MSGWDGDCEEEVIDGETGLGWRLTTALGGGVAESVDTTVGDRRVEVGEGREVSCANGFPEMV